MDYQANIVPTIGEMASGSLEPTSKAFKGYVGMVRLAPYYALVMTAAGFVAATVGFIPMDVTRIVFQGVGTAIFMAFFGLTRVVKNRKPSIQQICRLANLVRLDPSLAQKVNAMVERDYTFRKLQRFILENSAQANGVEMELALDELDDAINGRLC